jgi:hypothetical protein
MMHHKVTIIIKKKQASKQASAPPQEWYNSLPKKSLTQCVISWAEGEEQLNQTVISRVLSPPLPFPTHFSNAKNGMLELC